MASNASSERPESDPSRYELVRPLGEGSAGAVFLARDRETGERLALKKLFHMDAHSVARFKREFRALANLQHPNLIELYDLSRGPDAFFLTMEFVDGCDLRRWLQPELPPTAANEAARGARIVDAFYQLACGVHAVHRAGMLHRDLKPSNVLVAHSGRVVVLDFGLVGELHGERALPQADAVAGTPAYMPPEQAAGGALSEASDWYALGAMLYEVLRGQLPIDGSNVTQLLQRKLHQDPLPLTAADPGPPALHELCMRLLARDATQRPTGDDVLAVLARCHVRAPELTASLPPERERDSARPQLIGRERELAALRAALARVHAGESVAVHVRGSSGAGKSALVEHFMQRLAREPGVYAPLLLRSRCHEREAIPFKALDGAIDALVEALAAEPELEVAQLLPDGIAELAQVFPALERLPAVKRLSLGRVLASDAAESRRRAEQVLSELMRRLAARRTLLLWIDDLQWGDLDSARVLAPWLEAPDGPRALLIFTYRSDDCDTSACVRALLPQPSAAASGRALTLDLTELSERDVRALCVQRLSDAPVPETLLARIVSEARGNPFLAQQLSALALAQRARGDHALGSISVGELVQRTSELLAEPARVLLAVLAIAGQPLAPQLALQAANIHEHGRAHVHALQVLRLSRAREIAGRRRLEVYHDRVREAVQASLSAAERARLHQQLLAAALASQHAEPAWLHVLALGAGDRAAALQHGLTAAAHAFASLAFERAAELYATCLQLNDDPGATGELWLRAATALGVCGRGAAAAEAYLKAADLATGAARTELLRSAASHLLRSGRFVEGERLVREVLRASKQEIPARSLPLMAAVAFEHARVAWLERRTVAPAAEPARAAHAQLYGSLALEMQLAAPLQAALFQARASRLALESGDALLIARASCLAAPLEVSPGTPGALRRGAALLERAERLSQQLDSPLLRLELLGSRALCAHMSGRPADALAPAEAAERIYETRTAAGTRGDYFHMFAVSLTRIGALQALGRHARANAELREFLERARATDNHAAVWQASLSLTVAEQISEQCRGSRARLDAEYEQLPQRGGALLHVLHLVAVMRAACANSEYAWAKQRLEGGWDAFLDAPWHRGAYLACLAHVAHARLLLNECVASGRERSAAAAIRGDLKQLERLPSMPARDSGLARLRARLAYLKGDRARTNELLQASAAALDAADIRDDYQRDRYALGCLLGGAEGVQLKATALGALAALDVGDPVADVRAYFPELMRG